MKCTRFSPELIDCVLWKIKCPLGTLIAAEGKTQNNVSSSEFVVISLMRRKSRNQKQQKESISTARLKAIGFRNGQVEIGGEPILERQLTCVL